MPSRLILVATVALLFVGLPNAAKSQDQIAARLTLSVAGGPSSIGHPTSPHPFAEIASKSADAARRFAARTVNTDYDLPPFCTVRRWRCVLAGAFLGAGAGMLIGSALAAEPQYEPENTIFGTVNKCVAHCDDKGRNAARFGIAGIAIGAGVSFFLTR